MFTQPSSRIPKSPNDFAFQSQEYFSPFPDRSEDHDSMRYTDLFREQNTENNFSDGSNNSRYVKHPTDNWNDHLDAPAKRSRDGDGFRGMDNDSLPYQGIDYGHRRLAPPIHDGNADQPPTKAHQLEPQVKDLPIGITDQELFRLFDDGLNLMVKTDRGIRAILEFDMRLEWILSPIFKDWDLDAVTQRLGQGEEVVAAEKLEKLVWLTKRKIQHLYEEIVENVSSRRKAVKRNKDFTQPDPSKADLKFGGSSLPSYGDRDSNTPMSPYKKLPPDVYVQGSFPLVPDDYKPIPINTAHLPHWIKPSDAAGLLAIQ